MSCPNCIKLRKQLKDYKVNYESIPIVKTILEQLMLCGEQTLVPHVLPEKAASSVLNPSLFNILPYSLRS